MRDVYERACVALERIADALESRQTDRRCPMATVGADGGIERCIYHRGHMGDHTFRRVREATDAD